MKTQPLWSKMHAYHQHQGHIQAKRKGRDREGTLLPLETQPEVFLSSFHIQKTVMRPHLAPKRLRNIVLARGPDV